jgi:hypothetical protein
MEYPVKTAYGTLAGVALVLGLAFWVVLQPRSTSSCNSSLLPGAYSDALIPLHVVAAIALGACLLILSRGRWTVAGVAVAAVYLIACLLDHDVFMPAAIAGLLAWPALVVLLVVGVRARLARGFNVLGAQVVLWTALLVLLPGHFDAAYTRGAQLFCF